MYGYKGCKGVWEFGVIWWCRDAPLHGILTNKKFVPPTAVDGLGGGGGPNRSEWEGGGEY